MEVVALKTHVSSHGRHEVGDKYDEDKAWAKDKIKRKICALPDSEEAKAVLARKEENAKAEAEAKAKAEAEAKAKAEAEAKAKAEAEAKAKAQQQA